MFQFFKLIKIEFYFFLIVLVLIVCLWSPTAFAKKTTSLYPPSNGTYEDNKLNLVLIHSFPTNSIILKGLIDYLSDYFNVYFIDLPGFIQKQPPLKEVTLDNYVKFVEDKLKTIDLSKFWIGGISFGFLVANSVNLDDKIQGILAIEPFWGVNYLNITTSQKIIYTGVIKVINFFGLEKIIWKSPLVDRLFFDKAVSPQHTKIIKSEIDPKTFFNTATILMEHDGSHAFQKKPYVLIINKNDQTIKADEIIMSFNKNIQKGIVIHTSAEHFPRDISKEYFQKNIQQSEIDRFLSFTRSFDQNPQ